MTRITLPTIKASVLSLALCLIFSFSNAKPLLLSTDIGSDIDDTWALAHILKSPELDLELVLTETGESAYRASVTAKLLEIANRTDVAIALGIDFGKMQPLDRYQGPWIRDYELSEYPGKVHEDGIQAVIDYLESATETVTVIALGPAPSISKVVKMRPDLAKKCELYGMFGSFDRGYDNAPSPQPEYNVYANVDAFRDLMSAPWISITITPLDSCGIMLLEGENYQKIWASTGIPIIQAVIENYCIWAPRAPWMNDIFFTEKTSTLFDDVAVLMSYSSQFLEYETIQFSVDDDGLTRRDNNGPYRAKVAIGWTDLPGFQDFLIRRLLSTS